MRIVIKATEAELIVPGEVPEMPSSASLAPVA